MNFPQGPYEELWRSGYRRDLAGMLLLITFLGACAVAFLIAPGAIAFLWVRRFGPMLAVASTVALLGSLAGVYASFWLDSAPAPTIVLVLTLIFAASLVLTRLRRPAAAPV